MSLEHNLDQLDAWLNLAISKLTPSEQRKLLRRVGLDLRRENALRMEGQRAPDGSAWTPKKPQKVQKNKPVAFLYRKASGKMRKAEMKSYRREKGRLIGYDTVAGGIRTFLTSRIKDYLPPPEGSANAPKRKRRLETRMMRKIRKPRHLRLRFMNDGLRLGWWGRAGTIASIHHYGLRERQHYGEVDYPARELLGISESDKMIIRDLLLHHLGTMGKT